LEDDSGSGIPLPPIFFTPKVGMWKKAGLLFVFLFSSWFSQVFADPQMLKISDIHRVLERLFSFHIEMKELNPTIVRRAVKLYIEQFDPDKSYLLVSEVAPYLQLSDAKVAEMIGRLEAKDYSDFIALNHLFQKAIFRAEAIRAALTQDLLRQKIDISGFSSLPQAHYASSEQELVDRQEFRMIRFYLFHESRANLDTIERKAKVFSLYERKIRRIEAVVLFQDSMGVPLSKARQEHLMATKILKSFAKSLDTHTSFFSPEEAYEMRLSLEKHFEGIGVILSEGIDGVMIAELIAGSPAAQSGKIQLNDLLVEIDGTKLEALAFEEVLDLLKKKGRGEILLGFKRVDAEDKLETHYQVALKKQPIAMDEDRIQTSIEKFGDGYIGKISLYSFYENGEGVSSERDIKEAIRQLSTQGPLHGLVLDLRENSGGFLSQAVKVAGLFISNGVVVISKYGKGDVHYLRSIAGKQFFHGPVVVLTSKMSASAAEIVAQALQDYGVGIVVGDERTFGKGSIQFQTVTDANADVFFKITVGRYYTVSGRSTQIDGVIADIVVPTKYAPYNIGERFLEYPLPADSVHSAYVDPLTDLDEKTQKIFEKRYLPFLQRVVPYWKRILPQLQQNSAARINKNPDYQAFLRRLEKIKSRQSELPANTIDEQVKVGREDLQMNEAVNILKDMLLIEAENRPVETVLAPTGSD
jgi:carboxyl-terminal processing protease